MHAGRRLSEVLEKLNLSPEEAGELVGLKGSDMIYAYYRKPAFSEYIMRRLEPLKYEGVNLDYFEREDAPMLLEKAPPRPEKNKAPVPDVVAGDVQSLREVISLQKKYIENLEDQIKTLKENIALAEELKNLREGK